MISEIIYFLLYKQPENYKKDSDAVICTSNLDCSLIFNASLHGFLPGYYTKHWCAAKSLYVDIRSDGAPTGAQFEKAS